MSDQERAAIILEVNKALEEIRPHLKVDGGDIEVLDVSDEMEVSVKWLGNCEFCSMSLMTMKAGVEQAIMQKLPQITAVHAVNGVQAI